MGGQQKSVEIMIAGEKMSMPQRISGRELREIGNLNGRVLMIQRGNHKEIVNDSDALTLREGDTFVDAPIYRVG